MYQITLKAARANVNLSQGAVAEKMQVSKRTISNWEKGKTFPSAWQLQALCDLYGVPIDYIFLREKFAFSE